MPALALIPTTSCLNAGLFSDSHCRSETTQSMPSMTGMRKSHRTRS